MPASSWAPVVRQDYQQQSVSTPDDQQQPIPTANNQPEPLKNAIGIMFIMVLVFGLLPLVVWLTWTKLASSIIACYRWLLRRTCRQRRENPPRPLKLAEKWPMAPNNDMEMGVNPHWPNGKDSQVEVIRNDSHAVSFVTTQGFSPYGIPNPTHAEAPRDDFEHAYLYGHPKYTASLQTPSSSLE